MPTLFIIFIYIKTNNNESLWISGTSYLLLTISISYRQFLLGISSVLTVDEIGTTFNLP